MFEQYFLYVCIITFVSQLAGRSLITVGASAYDIRQAKEQKRTTKKQKDSILSVLVLAGNDEHVIAYCLDSILLPSSYKIEVIVIDNASTDATTQTVQRIIAKHPKASIRLIKKRKRQPLKDAYYSAAKYINGDTVLLLEGRHSLASDTLQEIQKAFTSPRKPGAVELCVQALPYPGFVPLVNRFDYLLSTQIQKASDILVDRYFSPIKPAFAYTKQAFMAFKKAPKAMWARDTQWLLHAHSVKFSSAATVYIQPTLSPSKLYIHEQSRRLARPLLNWELSYWQVGYVAVQKLIAVTKVIEPVMLTYFFYLAYTGRNSTLFLLSFIAFFIWAALAIWSEHRSSPNTKLGLLALSPIMYLLFYVRQMLYLIIGIVHLIFYDLQRAGKLALRPLWATWRKAFC